MADESHPIIWVTKLIRQKTKKPYYAIIGAEAVNKIAEAKLYEADLPRNNGQFPEKLLDMRKFSFNRVCSSVNKKLGFGLVSEESKLRPHMLRKFNATHIRGSALTYEEQSISNNEIDEMQGRGKTATQDTYIKTNPLEQKLIYAKVMNNLSLYHQYDYSIVDGDVVLKLRDPLSENKKLQKEVKKLNDELKVKRESSKKIRELRKELGEDVFDSMILEILSAP